MIKFSKEERKIIENRAKFLYYFDQITTENIVESVEDVIKAMEVLTKKKIPDKDREYVSYSVLEVILETIIKLKEK